MGIKKYTAYTPSRRHMTSSDFSEITKTTPEKSLVVSLKKNCYRYRVRSKQKRQHRINLLRRWYQVLHLSSSWINRRYEGYERRAG